MSIAWPRSTGGRIVAVIIGIIVLLILISAASWIWLKSTQPNISDPPPGCWRC